MEKDKINTSDFQNADIQNTDAKNAGDVSDSAARERYMQEMEDLHGTEEKTDPFYEEWMKENDLGFSDVYTGEDALPEEELDGQFPEDKEYSGSRRADGVSKRKDTLRHSRKAHEPASVKGISHAEETGAERPAPGRNAPSDEYTGHDWQEGLVNEDAFTAENAAMDAAAGSPDGKELSEKTGKGSSYWGQPAGSWNTGSYDKVPFSSMASYGYGAGYDNFGMDPELDAAAEGLMQTGYNGSNAGTLYSASGDMHSPEHGGAGYSSSDMFTVQNDTEMHSSSGQNSSAVRFGDARSYERKEKDIFSGDGPVRDERWTGTDIWQNKGSDGFISPGRQFFVRDAEGRNNAETTPYTEGAVYRAENASDNRYEEMGALGYSRRGPGENNGDLSRDEGGVRFKDHSNDGGVSEGGKEAWNGISGGVRYSGDDISPYASVIPGPGDVKNDLGKNFGYIDAAADNYPESTETHSSPLYDGSHKSAGSDVYGPDGRASEPHSPMTYMDRMRRESELNGFSGDSSMTFEEYRDLVSGGPSDTGSDGFVSQKNQEFHASDKNSTLKEAVNAYRAENAGEPEYHGSGYSGTETGTGASGAHEPYGTESGKTDSAYENAAADGAASEGVNGTASSSAYSSYPYGRASQEGPSVDMYNGYGPEAYYQSLHGGSPYIYGRHGTAGVSETYVEEQLKYDDRRYGKDAPSGGGTGTDQYINDAYGRSDLESGHDASGEYDSYRNEAFKSRGANSDPFSRQNDGNSNGPFDGPGPGTGGSWNSGPVFGGAQAEGGGSGFVSISSYRGPTNMPERLGAAVIRGTGAFARRSFVAYASGTSIGGGLDIVTDAASLIGSVGDKMTSVMLRSAINDLPKQFAGVGFSKDDFMSIYNSHVLSKKDLSKIFDFEVINNGNGTEVVFKGIKTLRNKTDVREFHKAIQKYLSSTGLLGVNRGVASEFGMQKFTGPRRRVAGYTRLAYGKGLKRALKAMAGGNTKITEAMTKMFRLAITASPALMFTEGRHFRFRGRLLKRGMRYLSSNEMGAGLSYYMMLGRHGMTAARTSLMAVHTGRFFARSISKIFRKTAATKAAKAARKKLADLLKDYRPVQKISDFHKKMSEKRASARKKIEGRRTRLNNIRNAIGARIKNRIKRILDPFGLRTKFIGKIKGTRTYKAVSKVGKIVFAPIKIIFRIFAAIITAVSSLMSLIGILMMVFAIAAVVIMIATWTINYFTTVFNVSSAEEAVIDAAIEQVSESYNEHSALIQGLYTSGKYRNVTVHYEDVKDEDSYQADEHRATSEFYESTNIAEMLSMAHVYFNFDLTNAGKDRVREYLRMLYNGSHRNILKETTETVTWTENVTETVTGPDGSPVTVTRQVEHSITYIDADVTVRTYYFDGLFDCALKDSLDLGGGSSSSGSEAFLDPSSVTRKLNSEQQERFINDVVKYVRKYADAYGIKCYSAIIAQAINESGWNGSSLGYRYHNYFGMKCGSSWKGKSVNLATKEEYSPGTLTTINDNFRAYDSMEEGIKGYFEFINTPRYANLKNVRTPEEYLRLIKMDGWATSSTYVNDNLRVVYERDLTKYDPK